MPPATPRSGQPVGAYGIAVPPAPFAPRLNAVDDAAPHWTFTVEPENAAPPSSQGATTDLAVSGALAPVTFDVDDDGARTATVTIVGGTLAANAATQSARFLHRGPVDGERLVHPALTALGALAAHWAGQVALHAGGVLIDGQVWGILAGRSHGKSTTLAALAAAGLPVLTDDLLVIDHDLRAHAGPRCVDLRSSSVELFPSAVQVDAVPGRRSRHRVGLDPVPATAPIAGFLTLTWDDTTGRTPVSPADRLSLVATASTSRGMPLNPKLFLELATLPSFVVHRPQRLDALDATVELIASLDGRSGGAGARM